MARHIEAWMDGVRLADLGAIVIRDVSEPDPEMEIEYINRATRGGRDIQKRRRKALRVTIEAAIHELYDLNKRTAIRDAIAKWSSGSILELSNHPDRRLNVICLTEPGIGSVRDFNSQLNIELEANVIPYWEDKLANTASGSGASGSATLYIPGTAKEVPVDVTVASGNALSALTVTVACGGVTKRIKLSGMSSVTGAITFSRDEDDRLQIMSGSTNLLPYRVMNWTESNVVYWSADDLVVPAGTATVSWSASANRSVTFSARGRWL